MANNIKDVYKIPYTLKVSKLDMPISLRFGMVGPKKPVPFKVLLIIFGTVILWFTSIYFMFKSEFGFISMSTFTIAYIILSILALKKQPNGLMGYRWFKPTFEYVIKRKDRFIQTRGTAGDREVLKLQWSIPLEEVDEQNGLIHYTNGDVGIVLDVIGNGSRALFTQEKEEIIMAFERVLRQMELNVTLTIESKQSKQDCSEQLANLEELRRKNTSPTIDRIISERIDILENEIETKFKSTHQYLHLRAPDEDRLNTTLQLLRQQKNQGLFRYMVAMNGEKQLDRLTAFYSLS